VSGSWTLSLTPLDGDAGVSTSLPRPDTILAQLTQVRPPGIALGRLLYGTLTSTDKGFFDTVSIPMLTMNDGSKTGSMLGCSLSINVPIATPVSDDNRDQGPLRIALAGRIAARGQLVGDSQRSSLVAVDDQTQTARHFAWSGTQP
jgi:hypothetical protein